MHVQFILPNITSQVSHSFFSGQSELQREVGVERPEDRISGATSIPKEIPKVNTGIIL